MPRTAISPATNNSFSSIIQDKNQIENQLDSEFVGYNINASKIEPEPKVALEEVKVNPIIDQPLQTTQTIIR